MNALLAGFFELMTLLAAIFAFLSSCDIIMRFALQIYINFLKRKRNQQNFCENPSFVES